MFYKTLESGLWNIAIESDFPEQSVSAGWTHIPSGDVQLVTYPLPYWVSALALDNDGLGFSVAGKRRNGNNVIDHYRITPPLPPGSVDPSPSAAVVSATNVYDDVAEREDLILSLIHI